MEKLGQKRRPKSPKLPLDLTLDIIMECNHALLQSSQSHVAFAHSQICSHWPISNSFVDLSWGILLRMYSK